MLPFSTVHNAQKEKKLVSTFQMMYFRQPLVMQRWWHNKKRWEQMGSLHANATFTTTINALAINSLAIPFCTILLFVPNLYFIIVIDLPPTIFLNHYFHTHWQSYNYSWHFKNNNKNGQHKVVYKTSGYTPTLSSKLTLTYMVL
jgi:hypothetical protein